MIHYLIGTTRFHQEKYKVIYCSPLSTEREQKGVGANIDNLHKAGLGQGFGIVDCGMEKKG